MTLEKVVFKAVMVVLFVVAVLFIISPLSVWIGGTLYVWSGGMFTPQFFVLSAFAALLYVAWTKFWEWLKEV